MQAGVGLLILDVMPIYWSLPRYRHDYLKFYQLPNSNLFTHHMLFSREKPLVESTGPGSIFSSYILRSILQFAIFFICIFYFRIYIIKNPKIPHWILFAFICIYQSITILSRQLDNSGTVIRKGSTTPLTRRVASICSLCTGTVYVVLRGSPTGSITLVSSLREIPTVAVLHHPFLFGEIPT